MDTKRLQHFLAVFETGSFCQAATTVHVTQPALTKSIKLLEDRLGVKLFDRTPLGVSPTPYGEALAEHAKVIRAEIISAKQQLSMLRGATGGHVVVGIGPSIADDLMPQATARLYQWKPGIRLTVVEGLFEDIIPALRRGELDLAVTVWPCCKDPDLTAEVLFRDQVAILSGADHPLAARASVEVAELMEYPWALPAKKVIWRHYLDQIFASAGFSPPEAAVTSTSAVFLRSLILQGSFLGFLPHRLMITDEKAGRIVRLNVPESTLDIDVTLTYRQRTAISPAARALITILHDIVSSNKFNTI